MNYSIYICDSSTVFLKNKIQLKNRKKCTNQIKTKKASQVIKNREHYYTNQSYFFSEHLVMATLKLSKIQVFGVYRVIRRRKE